MNPNLRSALLTSVFCVLASSVLSGCSTSFMDPYATIDGKTKDYLYAFQKNKMRNNSLSFAEFARNAKIKTIYVHAGDTMSVRDVLTGIVALADGYTVEDITKNGNRIFAIPFRSYSEEVPPKKVDFWIAAERGNRMYLLSAPIWSLKDFNTTFHRMK